MNDGSTADAGSSGTLDRPKPAACGYAMPPEWAPHRGTWLSWPHNQDTWPGMFGRIPAVFAEIVYHLASREEVHINVPDPTVEAAAAAAIARRGTPLGKVVFHSIPTNDAWCRDHGPVFVQRRGAGGSESLIVDWGYNAWGGKYPPYEHDDRVPRLMGERLGIPVVAPGVIMEGGSFDVNGAGTLLTTESCLLNPNRNPNLSRDEIETSLRDYLGVHHILWLGDGIEGDDTDGHIDDLTRFVGPSTVVTAIEPDPRDVNHRPLRDNLERLQSMTDQDGHPLDIVPLPMPKPLYHAGHRLPASYANFYVANGVVLLPGYDAARDAMARETVASLFPGREVIVIDCRDLVWGLGAIHCVTQQWPAE